MRSDPSTVLTVDGLRVSFPGTGDVVRGVSFALRPGETLALVGESGAGKSLTARALLGLAPREARVAGTVRLHGRPVTAGDLGRRISLVPQDALSALSPVHRVADQLALAARSLDPRLTRRESLGRAGEALLAVGLDGTRASAYPHQLSGGQRQRAVIAMATLGSPGVLVADEPTTALDPEVRAHVLRLLRATGAALLLVTHDLDTVRNHADRMAVMYAGRLMETGPAADILKNPRAPYTTALVGAVPSAGTPHRSRLPVVAGQAPAPGTPARGCAFAARCAHAEATCRTTVPALVPLPGDRELACPILESA
ncbi:ABC transporter ATP-binding protein [Streptomyces sp. NPDC057854]|uniref:ABC transporter ATP-binding protein n=1 Tax=unclassified Streptomyces TaxID=2593676 RepID=UPI0036A617A8